jgi:hypothetical protein
LFFDVCAENEGGVGVGDPEITTAELPGMAQVTVGWFVPTLDGASRIPYFYQLSSGTVRRPLKPMNNRSDSEKKYQTKGINIKHNKHCQRPLPKVLSYSENGG